MPHPGGLHGQNVMGWSKESSQAEWDESNKDPRTKRDKLGLGGCERLWMGVIEETHNDNQVEKSYLLEESGAQEKAEAMDKDERGILLNHVKSNSKNRDFEGFFNELPVAHEEGAEALVTPDKKKKHALDDKEKETPAEKKLRVKYEKLSSSGPQFTAFKTTCSTKMLEKLNTVASMADKAKAKLQEAKDSVVEAKLTTSHPVLVSYEACLAACESVLVCWSPEVADPAGKEAAAQASQLADALKQALEKAGTDVKLVNGDATLHTKGWFMFQAEALKLISSAKDVTDLQTDVTKTHFPTVELFIKALLKIGNDVCNYIKQKEKSKERAESKKKRQEEQVQASKVKEAARSAAQKAKMFEKQTHNIFGIKHSCWNEFIVNTGKDFDIAQHLDLPWVLRATETVKTWRNHSESSIKLAEFGGAYRKAPSIKVDGRAMAPVMPKHGKEPAEALIRTVFPVTKKELLDMDSLPDAAHFQQNIWYWGFEPKMAGGFLSPNAAAMIRAVAMGSITVVAFNLKAVLKHMKKPGEATLVDVQSFILNMDDSYISEHGEDKI